jgi:hypothetical protein
VIRERGGDHRDVHHAAARLQQQVYGYEDLGRRVGRALRELNEAVQNVRGTNPDTDLSAIEEIAGQLRAEVTAGFGNRVEAALQRLEGTLSNTSTRYNDIQAIRTNVGELNGGALHTRMNWLEAAISRIESRLSSAEVGADPYLGIPLALSNQYQMMQNLEVEILTNRCLQLIGETGPIRTMIVTMLRYTLGQVQRNSGGRYPTAMLITAGGDPRNHEGPTIVTHSLRTTKDDDQSSNVYTQYFCASPGWMEAVCTTLTNGTPTGSGTLTHEMLITQPPVWSTPGYTVHHLYMDITVLRSPLPYSMSVAVPPIAYLGNAAAVIAAARQAQYGGGTPLLPYAIPPIAQDLRIIVPDPVPPTT